MGCDPVRKEKKNKVSSSFYPPLRVGFLFLTSAIPAGPYIDVETAGEKRDGPRLVRFQKKKVLAPQRTRTTTRRDFQPSVQSSCSTKKERGGNLWIVADLMNNKGIITKGLDLFHGKVPKIIHNEKNLLDLLSLFSLRTIRSKRAEQALYLRSARYMKNKEK